MDTVLDVLLVSALLFLGGGLGVFVGVGWKYDDLRNTQATFQAGLNLILEKVGGDVDKSNAGELTIKINELRMMIRLKQTRIRWAQGSMLIGLGLLLIVVFGR